MDESLLITLVEAHPNIFDKQRKDFKDARIKENSWAAIAAAMDETVEECQRVWRLLRDRYSKERRLMKTETSGDDGEHTVWSLFNALQFLEAHVQPRKTVSNVKINEASTSRASPNVPAVLADPSVEVIYTDGEEDEDQNEGAAEVPQTTPRGRKRPSTDNLSVVVEALSGYFTKKKDETADDAFLKFVACSYKQLLPQKRRKFRKIIIDSLTDLEEEDYE